MGIAPLNSIVFPAPSPPYYKQNHTNQIWIPKTSLDNETVQNDLYSKHNLVPNENLQDKKSKSNTKLSLQNIGKYFIPCMFLESKTPSSTQVIYWHGNGEDIGTSPPFQNPISDMFDFNILVVEYPGYGVYNGLSPSGDKIRKDAEIVYNYATETLGIKQENIILFGRSLGSGPATYLASKFKPYGLILMSGYTSIKQAAKDLTMFGFVVSDRFNNVKQIDKVSSPTLLIHGKVDTVINCSHSQNLYEKCTAQTKVLKMPNNMGHNKFNFNVDILQNIGEFLNDLKFDNKNENDFLPLDKIHKLRLNGQ